MSDILKQDFTSVDEFVKDINAHRLANKNKWWQYGGDVCGKWVVIKAYNTWVQIMKVDSTRDGSCGELLVKDFKDYIRERVEA